MRVTFVKSTCNILLYFYLTKFITNRTKCHSDSQSKFEPYLFFSGLQIYSRPTEKKNNDPKTDVAIRCLKTSQSKGKHIWQHTKS